MNVTRWNGEPICKPGIYSGVPMDAYHGQLTLGESVSRSGLWKIFDKSAAHYFDESYLNPNRKEREEPEHFVLGRAAHHLLLGEGDFRKHFTVRPAKLEGEAWHGNRTVCKQWLAAQRDAGLTVITEAQVEAVKGMAATLGAHPLVRAGMLNGLIEHSFVWQDEQTGVWLKIRPDAIPTADLDFSDLKTTADISDDGLIKAIGRDGLAMQGGMTAMACRAVFGREMTAFTLVFVEKARPFCVRAHTLTPDDLKLGEDQARIALRVFARCIERGEWPGPGGAQRDAEFLSMGARARDRAQARIATLALELEQAA